MSSAGPLLQVRDLVVEFATEQGRARAVDGVSFSVQAGETVALVGESGCGKSVTALALMGLIPSPPGRIVSGSIVFGGQELTALHAEQLRRLRGNALAMIFQEPMTALNPVFRIGTQLSDVLCYQQGLTRRQARTAAVEMLAKVGMPDPARRYTEYPHQLSGGMQQRVMIAMALGCNPRLLIADEPTTALDVTTQAQVLELITGLQRELGMAMILITHDLGVVAETCERAIVMYCGSVVESSPSAALFRTPRHPYTAGLLASVPRLRKERLARLPVIEGTVPDLLQLPPGCRFADRCSKAMDRCHLAQPELKVLTNTDTAVACYAPN